MKRYFTTVTHVASLFVIVGVKNHQPPVPVLIGVQLRRHSVLVQQLRLKRTRLSTSQNTHITHAHIDELPNKNINSTVETKKH